LNTIPVVGAAELGDVPTLGDDVIARGVFPPSVIVDGSAANAGRAVKAKASNRVASPNLMCNALILSSFHPQVD